MTEFDPREKLMGHPLQLAAFIANDWTASPVGVEVSPTNSCTAVCPWCFYVASSYKQHHSKEELDFETMKKMVQDLGDMGVKSLTWTGGGDPSVYSRIDDAILEAHEHGLQQGMFTNAYLPIARPDLLDWIRITVTEKFVITKHVARYAKATKVGVNFNLCKENEDRLLPMLTAAKDAGVGYFQVRPALADRADLQQPVELPKDLVQHETPDFRIVTTGYKWEDYLQPHGYPVCHGHRFVPFVWHNGDVATCAYHFGREPYTLGNLHRDGGFKAVWLSERRRDMIDVPVIPECQHCCKLHEINKPLAALRGESATVADEDFI